MNRQAKKIILVSVAVLLVIALCAGLVMLLRKDTFGESALTRNQAVATIEGTKITRNQFDYAVASYYNNISTYNMYAMYGMGTYYDTSSEEGMLQMKNDILDDLINSEAYILLAKELGITLTAEEEQAAKDAGKEALADLKAQILESAQSSGAANPATYADTMLANYFSNMGINQRTFVERNTHSELAQTYAQKLQEHYAEERNVQDSELEAIYADYVQQYYVDAYTDGAYSQQADYVAQGYSQIPYLYIPEDFLFVRAIEVTDEAAFEDIMGKITAGEDFETFVAAEENTNEAVKSLSADKGQAIGEKDSPFADEVYALLKDMEVGAVDSVKVSSVDSEGNETATWYILKRVEGTTGVVPYAEVKDLVDDVLKNYAQSTYYSEQFDAWKAQAAITKDEAYVAAFDPAV